MDLLVRFLKFTKVGAKEVAKKRCWNRSIEMIKWKIKCLWTDKVSLYQNQKGKIPKYHMIDVARQYGNVYIRLSQLSPLYNNKIIKIKK